MNISADGRFVVAAYGDGTIRWHRAEDGKELLAFFPHPNRTDWVAWTEEEDAVFYAATPGAYGMLRWQINDEEQPWDVTPRLIRVASVKETRNPELIRHLLPAGGFDAAAAAALRARQRAARDRILEHEPKGVLDILAIGIGDPGPALPHLKLRFAAAAADHLCAALENTQDALWEETRAYALLDGDATRAGIARALDLMAQKVGPEDLAVIFFAGHGAMAEEELHLLPHGPTGVDPVSLRIGALPAAELRRDVQRIAQRGRVLLLLDCCHAGGMHVSADAGLDARALRMALAQANVAVMTGCEAHEIAMELEAHGHDAFTAALLGALSHGRDEGDGLLSLAALIPDVAGRLGALTRGKQRLGFESRFDGDVFVATGV